LRKRTQCQHIVCFLDCTPNSPGDQGYFKSLDLDKIAKDTGVSIVSAGQLGSTAPASGAGLITSFSQYVNEAMQVSGGAIPIANLVTYVQNSFTQDFPVGSGSSEQVVYAIAPGCDQIGDIHLGGRSRNGWSSTQVNVGHNPDTLALQRPDLVQNGTRPGGQTVITGSKEPPVLVADRKIINGSTPEDTDDTPVVNVDYGMYMEKMKADIRGKWRPPKGLELHRVVTTFQIMRDGVIVEPVVTESSGIPSVDQSAIDALKSASPLDSLPSGAPRSIAIRYVFDWRVQKI
jgi:TonB family protein